jgi:hypothetical protein
MTGRSLAFVFGRLQLEAGCFLTGTDEPKQKAQAGSLKRINDERGSSRYR